MRVIGVRLFSILDDNTDKEQAISIMIITIDDFRGACAVKGKVPVAGHIKRVDYGDTFDA